MNSALSVERTVAIIKPHAISHRTSIVGRIRSAGLTVLQERYAKLSAEQARNFLQGQSSDVEIAAEVEEWASGVIIALCIAGENAIESLKALMGPRNCKVARERAPTSIRALYGDGDVIAKNAIHGSETADDAQRELRLFFPSTIPRVETPVSEDLCDYLCRNVIPSLTDALYELLRVKPSEPVEFVARHLLENNVNRPLMYDACPETMRLVRDTRKREKEGEERNANQKSVEVETAKCGCSKSVASSCSSFM